MEGGEQGAVANQRHPLVDFFLAEHPDCDEDLAERALLVYFDLLQVKKWSYVELAFSYHVDRPYVIGHRNNLTPQHSVLPFSVEEKISILATKQYFSRVVVDEEPQNILYIAVVDLDSTIVYYKLTSGLCPPDPPDVVAARREEKDAKMDRKRRHLAKCVREANERLALAAALDEEDDEVL